MCEARRRSPLGKVDDNIVLLCRETRDGNNLYQELSFTDNDALADIDEGADLTGGKQQQHAAHYWGSEYSDKYKCNIFFC